MEKSIRKIIAGPAARRDDSFHLDGKQARADAALDVLYVPHDRGADRAGERDHPEVLVTNGVPVLLHGVPWLQGDLPTIRFTLLHRRMRSGRGGESRSCRTLLSRLVVSMAAAERLSARRLSSFLSVSSSLSLSPPARSCGLRAHTPLLALPFLALAHRTSLESWSLSTRWWRRWTNTLRTCASWTLCSISKRRIL